MLHYTQLRKPQLLTTENCRVELTNASTFEETSGEDCIVKKTENIWRNNNDFMN
jgi:hypothetical protein